MAVEQVYAFSLLILPRQGGGDHRFFLRPQASTDQLLKYITCGVIPQTALRPAHSGVSRGAFFKNKIITNNSFIISLRVSACAVWHHTALERGETET